MKATNTLDYSFQCKRNICHSHSKEGSAKVSSVVKQPPSHYKACCIYGNECLQSLKRDEWQEPEVTHNALHYIKYSILNLSAMHSYMHTYTFTQTHWTLSVLFMHRFTSLACSENTTQECQQHPVKCISDQTILIHFNCTSEVCIYITRKPVAHTQGWGCKHKHTHTRTHKPHVHTHTVRHLHFLLWKWSWGGRLCPVWPLAPLHRLRPGLPWQHLTVDQTKDRSKN